MARDYAGGTDRINFGSPSELANLSAISVSAIIKVDTFINLGSAVYPRIVSKNQWEFLITPASGGPTAQSLAFTVSYSSSILISESQTNQLNNSDVFAVCVTWDGGATASTSVKLYANGVEAASYAGLANGSGTRNDDAASDVIIGNRAAANRGTDGLISEVGIWDVVLTASEVASLGKRMKPSRVRPQNLKFYAPSIREAIDLRGLTGTVTGATVANQPRIY
jgi:hypothetical protein